MDNIVFASEIATDIAKFASYFLISLSNSRGTYTFLQLTEITANKRTK